MALHYEEKYETALPESMQDGYEDNETSLEMIRTISRIPGNDNYHNKDGLRTEGDGEDHENFQVRETGLI